MSQEVLASLLKSARYEILPTAGVVDRVHEYVVPGRVITVTASTGLTLEATLSTAEQPQALGFTAVPTSRHGWSKAEPNSRRSSTA